MRKQEQEYIWATKQRLVEEFFHGKCDVCSKKFKNGKGITFHHYFYDEENIDYKTLEGYIKLFMQIRKNPSQFSAVCTGEHQMITWLTRMKNKKFRRLIKVVRKTRKYQSPG